ncbi:helix-turn-helix domain-containing protein [Alphaproteobacteria bacterium LSUCC0684]
MTSLLTISKAQDQLREQVKAMRLGQGFTQEGLAKRAGVPLPTLRKFEQKGLISLEAFLKILMVLGSLQELVSALENDEDQFGSIDDVLEGRLRKPRKYGWRT